MANEKIQVEQGVTESKDIQVESEDNHEEEMDSLMNEMTGDNSTSSEFNNSGDLSALVTDTVESNDDNIDAMLDSASKTSSDIEIAADSEEGGVDLNFLLKMPLTMTFEVGRAKMTIDELLSLGQGSVLELHRLVGENLDLFVSGKLIAQGEVVVSDEKFAAKITQIIPPEQRVKKMGGMDKTN